MKHNLLKIISDFIKNNKDGIKKISALVLVTATGCFISFYAGKQAGSGQAAVSGSSEGTGKENSSRTDSTLDGAPYFEFPPYASPSDATPSNAEIISPELLNLAFLYEEGTESVQPSDSFAGRLYGKLADMDAQWSSGIYDLYNYTPERLAAQMGIPVQAVTTASGVIPEFRNINVMFLDGDGQASGSTSNARSIVAMANTLHYYGVLNTMEQMEEYISRMWKDSHHYSVQMGNVYYCDGSCRDTAVPQDGNGALDTAASDGGTETAGPESAPVEAGPETGSAQKRVAGNGDSETAASGSGNAELEAAENALVMTESAMPSGTEGAVSSGTEDTMPSGTKDAASSGTGVTAPAQSSASPPDGTAIPAAASEAGGPGSEGSAGGEQPPETLCPGHVDFSVSITIKGITENNGLFKADTLTADSSGRSGWKGWEETSMGWVKTLCGQDWQEEYGLNTTDLFVRNPLTSAEIDIYMSLVPEDTSQMKKDFIRYALSSVGKIPYYWGGKPTSPGYTGNSFGSVVSPDVDGRFLGGLDCSGWINWVYWSVTGRGLGAEGTGTMINSGTAITKSQLVPGDICIRTGSSAHVVIFLGWAADGQMMCIQETSGSVNNVEVGITTPDWQSYRRIID